MRYVTNDPQKRPMTVAESHANLLPPQMTASNNITEAGAKRANPIRSNSVINFFQFDLRGCFSVCSGIVTVVRTRSTTPAGGKLM